MTNIEVIQLALRRVGLDDNATVYKNSARQYLNISAKEIAARHKWNWLFKSSSFNTVASTQKYSLASDALQPLSFRNTTEDHTMAIISSQDLDANDPNHTEDGDASYVVMDGVDSSGYIQVSLYPTPDSIDTVAYRYYATIPEFSSSDDNNSLDPYVAPVVQPALVYLITSHYKQEKGDDQGSLLDRNNAERVIAGALRANLYIEGNRQFRMRRRDGGAVGPFSFSVQEGSLN